LKKKEEIISYNPTREHLNLRLIVVIPVVFILASLSVGLWAMSLTQFALKPAMPNPADLLYIRSWIVGSSLLAGLLGAFLAYRITKPVKMAILEARKMIQYVKADLPPIKAVNEVGVLSTLFDQAFVSFVELAQAREMLDSINEGIVALDEGGRIAGMNLKAQETLEISLDQAKQKSLNDLLGPASANSILIGIAQSVLSEREDRIHNLVPLRSPSGKETFLSVRASPLRLKRQPHEFLGVIITFQEKSMGHLQLPEMIGKSPKFTEVLDLAVKVAPTDSTVLLLGESGTGKELVADAIHRLGRRKDKPFAKINCGAIPEGLLESDLFGHERGAFTGAVSKKAGKFELADGGTVFLDEIGDLTLATQVKLLRFLQQKEFTPVGATEVKRVDVRIISATNRDLLIEVQQGRFREDLFYRLNTITLSLPPLRERKLDIPFLADHLLEKIAERSQAERKSLSRSSLDCLLAYSWPGNVRELENTLERAVLVSNGSVIQPQDLPLPPEADGTEATHLAGGMGPLDATNSVEAQHATLNETLDAVEKELIIQALKKSGGIQVEAAKLLGLNRKNLWHKIKKHKIIAGDLKSAQF